MLCSTSTGKSASNWLHRLRSSKGFPAAEQIDLEQFLSQNPPNLSNSSSNTNVTNSTANQIDRNFSSNSAHHDKIPVVNGNRVGAEERGWSGEMSNVLSELFYMGDTKKNLSKKSCRKQRNPKFCHVSVSKINEDGCTVSGALNVSLDNSRKKKEMSGRLKLKEKGGVNVGHVDGEGEEERGNADLSGFSRTEVTVIDTSFPLWKFDKLLFRRKNVWKVRERKCKSIIVNKRKRKASLASEEGSTGEEKKQCSSSKDMDGADGLASHEGYGQSKKIGACKQPCVHGQDQEKRAPRKLKDGSSSVVLIKSIPTSKKNAQTI